MKCDGNTVTIPDRAEGIILVNINSYGGGSRLWHHEGYASSDVDSDDMHDEHFVAPNGYSSLGDSSMQDGLIDVVAVYGALHLGKLQVGLSKAIRLCQCKAVDIQINTMLPVQVDGEPWMQNPAKIQVSFYKQVSSLNAYNE